jgi:hypothetical protein
MNRICLVGAKPAFSKWFMTAVFAIATVCLSSLTGATNVNAQTPSKPCGNPTTPTQNVVTKPSLDPSVMSIYDGGKYFGYRDIIGSVSLTTIVIAPFQALMMQIVGNITPTVVETNAINQIEFNAESPCTSTSGISGGMNR